MFIDLKHFCFNSITNTSSINYVNNHLRGRHIQQTTMHCRHRNLICNCEHPKDNYINSTTNNASNDLILSNNSDIKNYCYYILNFSCELVGRLVGIQKLFNPH